MAKAGKTAPRIARVLHLNRRSGRTAPTLRVRLALVASLFYPAASIQQAGTFTGKWRMDPSQTRQVVTLTPASGPNGLSSPPPPPENFDTEHITRSGDTLEVSQTFDGRTTSFTMKLDGSEQTRVDGELGIIMTHRSRFENGKITRDWKLERDGKVILEGQEVRILSEDGMRQAVDTTIKTAWNEAKNHIETTRVQ